MKKDRGITVQVSQMEECFLCWFTNGDLCLWLEMATSACGLFEGDFCLWLIDGFYPEK